MTFYLASGRGGCHPAMVQSACSEQLGAVGDSGGAGQLPTLRLILPDPELVAGPSGSRMVRGQRTCSAQGQLLANYWDIGKSFGLEGGECV